MGDIFQPPEGLVEAINSALHLRRPLLITGDPGSGKSTVIDSIASELQLGRVLRWHITSRSILDDALYRYDVLGRVHAQQLPNEQDRDDIASFLQLGPLGTALLPHDHPRALLIDEFDKGDFDLPGDLLDVLERGEYEIKELARHKEPMIEIREWGSNIVHPIHRGLVTCRSFPVIVITSNGERDFPAPFLRRCVRFHMPKPTPEFLHAVVRAHLGSEISEGDSASNIIETFLERLRSGDLVAIDQLLNAVYLLTSPEAPPAQLRKDVQDLLLRELTRT